MNWLDPYMGEIRPSTYEVKGQWTWSKPCYFYLVNTKFKNPFVAIFIKLGTGVHSPVINELIRFLGDDPPKVQRSKVNELEV